MLNISKLLFGATLMMGTILTISSETWLGMWMGLEINLISFIPIMYKSNNMMSSESCMIYFLIQSLGSILMLISVLSSSSIIITPYMMEDLFNTLLMFSMMIKLGVPPFHFWFPEILNKMNWINCTILMTWQKIAPLTIMSMIMNINIIPLIIIMSTLIGAIGGLNQTSIRKIMGYSSINHMGWMIACMKFNNQLWMYYLIIYSTIVIMMLLLFNSYSSYYINQLINLSSTFTEKSLIIILFMSLGGLPPFLGFLPKWIVIQSMINSNAFFILVIMVMSTLITLFYYLRLTSSILLINNSSLKWNFSKKLNKKLMLMMIMVNLSLPVMSTFSL